MVPAIRPEIREFCRRRVCAERERPSALSRLRRSRASLTGALARRSSAHARTPRWDVRARAPARRLGGGCTVDGLPRGGNALAHLRILARDTRLLFLMPAPRSRAAVSTTLAPTSRAHRIARVYASILRAWRVVRSPGAPARRPPACKCSRARRSQGAPASCTNRQHGATSVAAHSRSEVAERVAIGTCSARRVIQHLRSHPHCSALAAHPDSPTAPRSRAE